LGSDGFQVSHALVQTRGQSVFTKSDGSFTLENIPVIKDNDTVTVEVSYMRPDRAVDRTQRVAVPVSANLTTALNVDLVLPGRLSPDQPLLITPPRLTVNENQTLDFSVVANSQPAVGQGVQVAVSGAGFASILPNGSDIFTLRLSPGANSAGEYNVIVSAANNAGNAGVKSEQVISVRVRKPPSNAPTANDQCLVTSPGVGKNITLSGADPMGRTLQLLFFSSFSGGSIAGNLPNVTYTPRANFSGVDLATYRAVVSGTSVTSEPSLLYVIVR
jgi:hypothetical protein